MGLGDGFDGIAVGSVLQSILQSNGLIPDLLTMSVVCQGSLGFPWGKRHLMDHDCMRVTLHVGYHQRCEGRQNKLQDEVS